MDSISESYLLIFEIHVYLAQTSRKLPTNCLSLFDHFVGLALKGLKSFVGKVIVNLVCFLTRQYWQARHLLKSFALSSKFQEKMSISE